MTWFDSYRKKLFGQRFFLNEKENIQERDHLYKVQREIDAEDERREFLTKEYEDSDFIPKEKSFILQDPDGIITETIKEEEERQIMLEEKYFEQNVKELVQDELIPQHDSSKKKKKHKKRNKGYYNQSRR